MTDWTGLPAPSPAVMQGLKGIHPGLFVLRSRWDLDHSTGEKRIEPKTQLPIERPRYWVWIDHRGKKSPLFPIETPEGAYMACDSRVVKRIATDLGHTLQSAAEAWRAIVAHQKAQEQARRAAEKERVRRHLENNKPAWKRAMENLRNGVFSLPRAARMRDPVIYGYDGQPVRSSSHGTIPMTGKDLGPHTHKN